MLSKGQKTLPKKTETLLLLMLLLWPARVSESERQFSKMFLFSRTFPLLLFQFHKEGGCLRTCIRSASETKQLGLRHRAALSVKLHE